MANVKSCNNDSPVAPASGSDEIHAELICPKSRTKSRIKKRKRSSSESSNGEVLPENTLDMEKSLQASAIKNNLDDSSVKKILKKVVTNDHVLAYVKLREEEEDSGTDEGKMKPKLTRAKVKELMKVSPQCAPWNPERLELTPIKHIPVKTRPEVTALIAHDLPDEEDDDEYHPTLDDIASDDDHACSDLDSQPRTPATPQSLPASSPRVLRDGPFKVPTEINSLARRRLQSELQSEEDATIALRTRSKLSLSATPIEHIESSFVPPDEVPLPIVDDLWNQFLEECLNPASASRHEEDDDADPEYNVAADPDAHDEDEEALERSIIKISKKELNDLVTELFHIMPEDLETNGKGIRDDTEYPVNPPAPQVPLPCPLNWEKMPVSDDDIPLVIANGGRRNSCLSVGKTEPMEVEMEGYPIGGVEEPNLKGSANQQNVVSCPKPSSIQIEVEEADASVKQLCDSRHKPPPLLRTSIKSRQSTCIEIQVDADSVKVLPNQVLILEQQLRQHVQLCASNFLQLYVHPAYWHFAPPYKEYLETFEKILKKNPKSVVGVCNLQPALELIRSWAASVSDNTPENMSLVKFQQKEVEKSRKHYTQNRVYAGDFHESFKQVVANSGVFLYPHLLPAAPYRADNTRRNGYLRSEDELIALGLDQFWQYVEDNPQLYKRDARSASEEKRTRWGLTRAVELVCRYMFPFIQPRVMSNHIHFVKRTADKDNPLYKFFQKREIVPVKHKLLPFNPKLNLYQQPEHEMPYVWIKYLAKTSKRARNFMKRKIVTNGFAPEGVAVEFDESVKLPEKRPLPEDFTKTIVCTRKSLRSLAPKKNNEIKVEICLEGNKVEVKPPPAPNTVQNTFSTSAKMFQVVPQSSGTAVLVPLEVLPLTPTGNNTTTVTSLINPISTPAIIDNSTKDPKDPDPEATANIDEENSKKAKEVDSDNEREVYDDAVAERHCKCCALFQKIYKERQRTITEYFKAEGNGKAEMKCPCSKVKSPKITSRLRALVKSYECLLLGNCRRVDMAFSELNDPLRIRNSEQDKEKCKKKLNIEEPTPNADDLAYATVFNLKLLTHLAPVNYWRQRAQILELLTRFNTDTDSPVWLAKQLKVHLAKELMEVYREFAGFLTAEQADRVGSFKDYFIVNCVPELLGRIEQEVTDVTHRRKLLAALMEYMRSNMSSCELSYSLLTAAAGWPRLAAYLFSLFPHRRKDCVVRKSCESQAREASQSPLPADESATSVQRIGDCEADHSSSGEEEENANDTTLVGEGRRNCTAAMCESKQATLPEETSIISERTEDHDVSIKRTHMPLTIIKQEPAENVCIDTSELTIRKTRVQDYETSDMSKMIKSEDESIEAEPSEPWTKEEDKTILVLIKAIATNENQDNTERNLAEMNVYQELAKLLPHRTRSEVKDRVFYLLDLIALIKNQDI